MIPKMPDNNKDGRPMIWRDGANGFDIGNASERSIQRAYLFYTDDFNFEAVDLERVGNYLLVTWRAKGTGIKRQPEATISDDVIEIKGSSLQDQYCGDLDAKCVVPDAVGKTVVLVSPFKKNNN